MTSLKLNSISHGAVINIRQQEGTQNVWYMAFRTKKEGVICFVLERTVLENDITRYLNNDKVTPNNNECKHCIFDDLGELQIGFYRLGLADLRYWKNTTRAITEVQFRSTPAGGMSSGKSISYQNHQYVVYSDADWYADFDLLNIISIDEMVKLRNHKFLQ